MRGSQRLAYERRWKEHGARCGRRLGEARRGVQQEGTSVRILPEDLRPLWRAARARMRWRSRGTGRAGTRHDEERASMQDSQERVVRSKNKGSDSCAGQMREQSRQHRKQTSALSNEARNILTAAQRWMRGCARLRRTGSGSSSTGRATGRLTMSRRSVSRRRDQKDLPLVSKTPRPRRKLKN